jgi:hypothetical protein
MKQVLLFVALFSGIARVSAADGLCSPIAFDQENPAGITGLYVVVGQGPAERPAYSGTLELSFGSTSYTAVRTTQGKSVKGIARFESCGMDKSRVLVVRYRQPAMEARCAIGTAGDNYYRMTCLTRQGMHTKGGYEAWFQEP